MEFEEGIPSTSRNKICGTGEYLISTTMGSKKNQAIRYFIPSGERECWRGGMVHIGCGGAGDRFGSKEDSQEPSSEPKSKLIVE